MHTIFEITGHNFSIEAELTSIIQVIRFYKYISLYELFDFR